MARVFKTMASRWIRHLHREVLSGPVSDGSMMTDAATVPFRWTKAAESLANATVLKPPKFDQPFWNVGSPAAPTSCHAPRALRFP
jgi:hypothetical protein